MNRNWPEFVYPCADNMLRLRSSLTGRGCPLHRNESLHPFFIVGAPRSGNTLLRRILTASPGLHITPEIYVLRPVLRAFRRDRHRTWPNILGPILGLFEFHSKFHLFGVPLRPLFDRLSDTPPEARSLAFILDSVYRYHGECVGNPCVRWGDKTPLNVYSQRQIHQVFPGAKFIHIVRDGFDSVYSMIAKARFSWDLPSAARRWKTSVSTARAFARRYPDICYEVRYEDLVSGPSNVVPPLCQFLDLDFQPSMVDSLDHGALLGDVTDQEHHDNVMKPIMTDSVGKGRRELSSEQLKQLERLIGSELARWGYRSGR